MCETHRRFAPLLSHTLRRIPQAVGTIATLEEAKVWMRENNAFQHRKR